MRAQFLLGGYLGDHNTGAHRRNLVVLPRGTEISHQVYDACGALIVQARARGRDADFSIAIVVFQIHRHQPVAERILGFVHPGIFLRVAGENGVEIFDPELSQQKRVLASYISEIAYFYRIFIRDILEAPDTKVNEAVKRSFRSNFNRYISAYFEDVFGKGSHFGEEIISFFEKRFSGAEHIPYSRIEEEAKDLLDILNLKLS